MKDVPYLRKDSKNAFHNYTYASELVIKTALHEAMVKHRVLFQLETTGSKVEENLEKNKKGEIQKATILSCRYNFWDVDTGESFGGEFQSAGPARDDKGLWAATTNAIKYILTSTFLIPTGDDAESDKNHPADNGGDDSNATQPVTLPQKEKSKPEPSKQSEKARFWFALQTKANTEKVDMPVNVKGFVEFIQNKFGTGRWDIMQVMLEESSVKKLKDNFIGSEYDKEIE